MIYKRLISLIALPAILIAQIPCLAQSVPTHMCMPPPMPVHQHDVGMSLPIPVHQHNVWTPSTMPVHQHDVGMSLPIPVHQHNVWTPSTMPIHQHNLGMPYHHHDIGQSISPNTQSTNNVTNNSHTIGAHLFHHLFGSGSNTNPSHDQSNSNSNSLANGQSHLPIHHVQPNSISNANLTSSLPGHIGSANHIQLWASMTPHTSSSAPSINLDLSSTTSTMTANHMLYGQTIYINVGGTQLNVTANTKLTPAEYLAVMQVISGGQQSLTLNAQGSATGGTLLINQHLSQMISSLVIPQGVTVIDLTRSGTLSLTGNITDDGSLYVTSMNHTLNTVTLDASNINVQAQGLISDVLPSTLSGLSSSSINSDLSLSLNAVNNINNAGTIQAANNVNLVSGTGNITNSGLITSTNGNINIASTTAANTINVSASAGTFQTLNGAINIRDSSYTGSGNINLNGGNYLSQQLNINSGTGSVFVNVGQLTGIVNTYAGSAQIEALTPDLNIGILNVTGDPFISNNAGNLNLNGSVTFPTSYLVATASGSIYTSSATTNINTSSNSGNGGNVVLAAGVTSTDTAGSISLARSGTGGDIYLTTGTTLNGNATQNITGFNTSTSNSGSSGGNVTLIAMSSVAGNNTGGHVFLPSTVQITTQGTGSGANGNLTVVAEATEPAANAISIGGVAASGTTFATGGGGNVTIITATPNLSGVTINDSTGAITGSFTSTNYQNGGITLGSGSGGIYSPATINIEGGSITTNGIISANTISLTTAPGTNGNITLNSNVTATTSATLTANGSGTITTPNNVIATISGGSLSGPEGVAVNAAGTLVYITNSNSNTVSVINTSTNTIVATITVGTTPIAAAVNAAGTLVYVANTNDNTVSVINTSNNTVVATIPVGTTPVGVAINPAGTLAYVTNEGGTVSVINTGNNTVVATIPVGVGTTPIGVAVNPTGTFVYTANYGNSTVSVINTNNNTVVATIPVDLHPIQVAVNPTGNFVYAASAVSSVVNVINTSTNTVVAYIPSSGSHAEGVAVNPAGTFAYVTNVFSGTVSIINTSTNTVAATVPVGSGPYSYGSFVGFVGNNVTAYVPNANANTVSVIQMPAIVAPTIALTSASGAINVGVGGATNVTANTSGNATITAPSTLNIGTSNVGGTFFVGSAGALNTTGAITANLVNFQSTLNNGTITIGANLTGTNGITLSTVGSSSAVLQTGGQISLPNGGLVLNTPQLGNSFSAININSAQPLTLSTPIIIGNTVTISTSSNSLQIANNVSLTATGGALILQDSLSSGNISIGANVSLTSYGDNLYIIVGNMPTAPFVKGTTPANVYVDTFGSGNVYFGQNSDNITSNNLVTINAFNHDVIFNIGSSLGSITLGGGAIVQAGVTPNPYYLHLYNYLVLLEFLQNTNTNNQNMLNEQIGTRIATDYTPWTLLREFPPTQQSPLQGHVSAEQAAVNKALFAASAFNANELNALSQQGIVFGPNSTGNFFDLLKGYVLFMPTSNINVQTREGLVSIPKGTVAWVMETGNDAAIYDMHDSLRTGPIKVIANKKELTLSPGTQVLLTRNSTANFDSLNPGSTIGYRNVKVSDAGDGIKAYVCDFSIAHGLSNVPTIRNLLKSDDPVQRKLAWQMIKNATILADLTGSDYKTGSPAQTH